VQGLTRVVPVVVCEEESGLVQRDAFFDRGCLELLGVVGIHDGRGARSLIREDVPMVGGGEQGGGEEEGDQEGEVGERMTVSAERAEVARGRTCSCQSGRGRE
jgi:hypothetical protein